MNPQLLYTPLLGIGVALCLATTVLAWRQRPTPGAVPLAGMSGGAAVWTFATFAQVVSDGFAPSVFWGKFVYAGIVVCGTAWFVLALEYGGKEQYLRPRYLGLLAIGPLAINALVWTNGYHGLVWTAVEPGASVYGFAMEYGVGFWVHSAYSYGLLVGGSLLVLSRLYSHRSIYRGQAAAMFVSVLAPWASNALWLTGLTTADWTPIGFVVSSLVLFWAMSSRDLADVTPVARDVVLDRIPSGVAVIDTADRVLDVNGEMERLLDRSYDELVGAPADEAFAGWPTLQTASTDESPETDHEVTLATEHGERYFDVEDVALFDDLDRRIGRILLVHDVTDQRRRERELERQNEQLDRFAEVLSHDLRNPLNVADGHAELLAETGDVSHVKDIQSAHDRMAELIEDVRALVKQGQSVADPEPVALEDVAREAAANVDMEGATVDVRPIGVVEADESRLLRALENLFRNAVEHGARRASGRDAPGDAVEHGSTSPRSQTPEDADEQRSSSPDSQARQDAVEHGAASSGRSDGERAADLTVTVGRLEDEGEATGFFVADDGPGIPAEDRDAVFEHGYSTGESGTGFGLSIVEKAVEAHGWSIAVTGNGSEDSSRTSDRTEDPDRETPGARFEITGVQFLHEESTDDSEADRVANPDPS